MLDTTESKFEDENEVLNEPNYIEELIELIRSDKGFTAIREEMSNYHDNDIACNRYRVGAYCKCKASDEGFEGGN